MGRQRMRTAQIEAARSFRELKGWPQEALDFLHAAFERKRQGAGPTWAELLGEIQQKFGVQWNDSSLSRYYGYWRSTLWVEDRARDEATAIVERLVAHPSPDLVTAAKQLLQQQRLLALTRMDAADPVDVVKLGLADEKLRITQEKLQLDQERQRIADEKLTLDKARLEIEREKKLAIDRPALFLEFFKSMVETLVQVDPQAAEVLNKHFDRLMVKVRGATA